MSWYQRLSAQDASFLVYEDRDPSAHMHIGGVSIYEPGALSNTRGGVDVERFRAYVASRLHLIPRYRQRLSALLLGGDPIWIDDDRFNVRYHVRHTRLPRPGDERELKRLAARVMSQRLDRTRPLWELWIVEGLPGGRFAVVTKTHHCMIDGVSGVDISTVLMQLEPGETAIPPAEPWMPRPAPGVAELLAAEARLRLALPVAAARAATTSREPTGMLAAARRVAAGAAQMVRLAWQGPAHTPLNRPIGPHRRFDWTTVSLDDAKAVKNALRGTLNDVVLTVVSGAIGRFLRRQRRVNVDFLDFIATIPVNIRAPGDRSEGNRVAAWFAPLPIAEADPRRRFERVHAVTQALKENAQSDPTVQLFALADVGGLPAVHAVVRLAQALNPTNVIITNVPGPPFPLYILGSRMVAALPLVTLLANQGIGIAVFSYTGRLHFGINADWDLVPDLHELVLEIERAFVELLAASRAQGPCAA